MAQSIVPWGTILICWSSGGCWCPGPPGLDLTAPVALVSYDSRQVVPGTLFVCKGAHFKAEFLQMARDKGAMAYVSLEPYPQVDLPCIRVTDMRETIAPLADLVLRPPLRRFERHRHHGDQGQVVHRLLPEVYFRRVSGGGGPPRLGRHLLHRHL